MRIELGPAVLYLGDCREIMRKLADGGALVDSVVTDPPYHLTQVSRNGSPRKNDPATPYGRTRLGERGFMGLTWDGGDVAMDPETWRLALQILKPGGHLLAFTGARTYHRIACAVEDAGFEIRDQIMWVYGSGFPKSLDVAKAGAAAWTGWGTALKPAHEPIIFARKPLDGTVANNVRMHGTGAINIDGCRVGGSGGCKTATPYTGGNPLHCFGAGLNDQRSPTVDGLGRFPANLIHDGSPEVLAAFPQAPGQLAKAADGADRRKTQNVYGAMVRSSNGADPGDELDKSAARFFYCAKASKKDRGDGNDHPTVKPQDLMRYLCRLVTPPGGVLLDPFGGSGSTGVGAIAEGFRPVVIEQDEHSFNIACGRIGMAVMEDLNT